VTRPSREYFYESIAERFEGFVQAMKVLEGGRIAMAAMAVRIGQAAVDQAVKYMKQRTAFGRTFAGLQGMIAELATEVETARLLTLQAAEFPVERIFRDAKLTEIGEGTSEIQRMVIAREILQLG